MQRSLFSLGISAFLLGCTPAPRPHDADKLASLLTQRIPNLPSQEAKRMAHDTTTYASTLEKRFKRTTSPYVHNFLVNLGVKKQGLCWHYADALYLRLKNRYPHLHVHLVGTHIGEYWREHNAVAVTGFDDNLSRAVILDAWRTPGKLIAVPIEEDKYKWEHRKEREVGY